MGARLTSLGLWAPLPKSLRNLRGVPLGVAAAPTRDAGVSKFRGELKSISDEGSCGGGEEKRGAPGLEDMTRRREAGGEVMSASFISSCCGGERTWSAAGAEGGIQMLCV